MIMFLLPLILSIALIMVNSSISKKSNTEREKPSPFECGFDPKNTSRIPFSLRFYLIAVVFLIFDVEIALILPMPLLINQMNFDLFMLLTSFFIWILILALFHEWNQGALNWDN